MKGIGLLGLAGLFVALVAFSPQQADRGSSAFQRNCAVCHGEQGLGGTVPQKFERLSGRKAPPLAGPQALQRFQTAGELFEYARSEMPQNDPGSLTDQTYLDVTAWMLQQQGLPPDGRPLASESAEGIRLPHPKK